MAPESLSSTGYSDLGAYGSEIKTPNLDALAKNGLRFTNFYNTARCWPTRASILTGYYPQQIRRDTLKTKSGGMRGKRPSWAPLAPALLKKAGYRSYHYDCSRFGERGKGGKSCRIFIFNVDTSYPWWICSDS